MFVILNENLDGDDDEVISSGDGNDDDGKPPTCKDYMLHFISFFWKFLFAFVPPTSKQMRSSRLHFSE